MTILTQIHHEAGVIRRVPPGERPVIELHLEPGQYVAGVEMRESWSSGRKTSDWYWSCAVVTPLP